MNKTLLIVIAGAFSLGGCASTQTVLDKPANAVYHSDKSMIDVAFCLANKNNVPAIETPDGGRVVLIKNGYGGVAIALTVHQDGTGSRTEVRNEFGIIGAAWKQCIGEQVSGTK